MWLGDWMRHTYIKLKKNEKKLQAKKNLLIIYEVSANFKKEGEEKKTINEQSKKKILQLKIISGSEHAYEIVS